MNYYPVDWSNLAMKSYWLTGGTDSCSTSTFHTYLGATWCAWEMGSFQKKGTFSTSARSVSSLDIPLTAPIADGANLALMLASCFANGNALVMSTGSVEEKTGLHDFGHVSISDQYFWLICN